MTKKSEPDASEYGTGVCRWCSTPLRFVEKISGDRPGTNGNLFECTNKDCPKPGFKELHPADDDDPSDEEIRKFIKELESGASDSLGELGCDMINNVIDAISDEFDMSEEKLEKLSARLAVGVVFELDEEDPHQSHLGERNNDI